MKSKNERSGKDKITGSYDYKRKVKKTIELLKTYNLVSRSTPLSCSEQKRLAKYFAMPNYSSDKGDKSVPVVTKNVNEKP